jgi:serine/threonine protein kinase
VMEYLEGVPLLPFVRKSRASLREVVDLCVTMAHAVAHVHEHGICHRDLKPANMYLCESGRVVLLDFGLCKPPRATPLTGPYGWVGTPEYLSPEYIAHFAEMVQLGKSPPPFEFSPVQDVYAFGVTLYQLLAGRLPFSFKDGPYLLRDIREKVPQHPSERNPELPRILGDLIMKMMDKDPARRPADGRAVVTELEAAVAACEAELDATFERSEAALARAEEMASATPTEPASTIRSPLLSLRRWFPPRIHRSLGRRLRGALKPAVLPLFLLALILNGLAWKAVLDRLPPPLDESERQCSPEMISSPGHSEAKADAPPKSKGSSAPAPLREQKRPPCQDKYEKEMNGACWYPARSKSCAEGYKTEEGCYMPVLPSPHQPIADP